MSKRRKDLTGHTFGRLEVIGLNQDLSKASKYVWDCVCECGKTHRTSSQCLVYGYTMSCGCLRDERQRSSENKNHGIYFHLLNKEAR